MMADNSDVMSARAECEDHRKLQKTFRPFRNKTNMSDNQSVQSFMPRDPRGKKRELIFELRR